jgi:hypothetical protein
MRGVFAVRPATKNGLKRLLWAISLITPHSIGKARFVGSGLSHDKTEVVAPKALEGRFRRKATT